MNCQDVPVPVKSSFGTIRHQHGIRTMIGFLRIDLAALHIALNRMERKIEEIERELER